MPASQDTRFGWGFPVTRRQRGWSCGRDGAAGLTSAQQRLAGTGHEPRELCLPKTSSRVIGTLESVSRQQAQDLIKELGGRAAGSVSKKNNLVVYGQAAGSKLSKARQLGVEAVDEAEFLRRIGRR